MFFMAEFVNNAIFWIELEKIKPNPYQPRKEFDQAHLLDLSDSIRQYGVLQPLVVTRKETERPDGGMDVEYELIAGERAAGHQTGERACARNCQQGVIDPQEKEMASLRIFSARI
jgi:ParB/RepB/Spo0J family partition protein